MTLEILEAAEAYLYQHEQLSIKIWRTVWRMFICFFCFLRFDDIRRLKVSTLLSCVKPQRKKFSKLLLNFCRLVI